MAASVTFRCVFFSALVLAVVASVASAAPLRAAAIRMDCSLPIGVPLAGYNHGARRVKDWPIPNNTDYTSFMTPSIGRLEPTWCRSLVIDDGSSRYYFLSVDAIGADGTLRKLMVDKAQAMGVNATLDNVMLHASHSHSGPGAVSPDFVWAMAPATDLLVPELQESLATSMAQALLEAELSLAPAVIGLGSGNLTGVTTNRRAGISPYLTPDSIDPHLGVIRVDKPDGTPIATLWNFAIHGTCWGPDQLNSNGDIMGGVNKVVEETLQLGVSLFVNADAGDVDPTSDTCSGKPDYKGAPIIANAIAQVRNAIKPDPYLVMTGASAVVPFGRTILNMTLARWENCTSGGPLDICALCEVLHCELNPHLGSSWLENTPRFTAVRFLSGGRATLFVTLPGEPLTELGKWVRGDGLALGFDDVFLAGYSNNHMGYFATPDEYDVGGYESELTFWGIQTAAKVRAGCALVAQQVRV